MRYLNQNYLNLKLRRGRVAVTSLLLLLLLIIGSLVEGISVQGSFWNGSIVSFGGGPASSAGNAADSRAKDPAAGKPTSADPLTADPQPSIGDGSQSPNAALSPAPLPSMPLGLPARANMLAAPLQGIDSVIQRSIEESLLPGAVVLVARDGVIVKHDAYGYAELYVLPGVRHPDPTPAARDTIYDLASLSKLFTATAVMQLVERGSIDLNAPVARYIPEFGVNDKAAVTVYQLLDHSSGLPEGLQLAKAGRTRDERLQTIFAAKLKFPSGTTRLYSDVGFETLGALVERVSGMRLDEFVTREILVPLQMTDTMYNPPSSLFSRIAATETNQPSTRRAMIRGQVHDPDAYSLDGVAGNAGVFSTAHDLAVFAQMILNRGQYGGARVLSEKTVNQMLQLQSESPNGEVSALGWDQNQAWYMGRLASRQAVGHTGYTGTSLVIDRASQTIVILLTNRVHPTARTNINKTRVDVANAVANALR